MSRMTFFAISPKLRPCALVVISPAITTSPVLISDSHATRLSGSCARMAPRYASEFWAQSLCGCPSCTVSDVGETIVSGLVSDDVVPEHSAGCLRCSPCALSSADDRAVSPAWRPTTRGRWSSLVLVELVRDQLADGVEGLARLRPARLDVDVA